MNLNKDLKPKNKVTVLYERLNRNILWTCLFKSIGGILLALLIAFSTNAVSQFAINQKEIRHEQLLVNSLIIGTNREYVDSTLGKPFLFNTNEKTNLEDCLYKVKGAIIRVFYEDNCAKGIFITLTDHKEKGIFAFDKYIELTDNNKLGEFIYDDLDTFSGCIDGNYSQHTNGIDILFYLESYYYCGWGGYYSHLYCTFPYGIFIPTNNESQNNYVHHATYGSQMGAEYPNTIGVVQNEYQSKICAMILDIDRIDYFSIKLYMEEVHEYYGVTFDKPTIGNPAIAPTKNEDFENYFSENLEAYLSKYYDDIY